MWGMAYLGAVQVFPVDPFASAWLAGVSTALAGALGFHAAWESRRRRRAEAGMADIRAQLSDSHARFSALRITQLLWEQRHRGLSGAHDDVVLWRDAQGRLTHMNSAFVATFGVCRQSLLGTNYHPPADGSVSGMPRGMPAGPGLTRIRYEQLLLTVRGWRWFAWEDHAIRAADGTLLEIQSTGRDVTDQRQARETTRAAGMAERTLRRNRESLRRALERDLLPPAARLARSAGEGAPEFRTLHSRLAALQHCLAFEGENVTVRSETFEPRRLMAAAVGTLAQEFRGGAIASLTAADVPDRVQGDPALLSELIERLAAPPLADGHGLCIRLAAAAGGLEFRFETPWPRAAGETAAPSDLALAAVRPLLEAMGGDLAVDPSDGAVSVRVEIPAPAAGETAAEDTARGAAGLRPPPVSCAGPA